ncbi:MAG: bifunctional diaminohydroxyphosphoribosylaminopyrimidine deaminase/5-amino-6-(5-phosphoribosylamino)uracil reductase RibD, partial [Terriglobia bacterium]
SGLKEVVVGAIDPNPRVEGLGASFLREKNLRVRVGLMAEEVMEQNEIYWKYTRTNRPFVLLKIAASLNGRIESPADDRWITGDQARTVVHQLRNDYDAVLTGVGTVEADDPRLDCRMPGVTNDPVRIVLDSRGRTPLSSQLVRNARKVRTVVVATGAGAAAASTLHRHGVELVVLPERDGKVDLEAFLDWAGENDISSLLVEAGARVNGSFVEQGLADKILFFIAPRFLDDSFSGAVAPGVRSDGFTITSVEGVGSDLAVILAPTPSRVIGGQPAGTDSPAQGHECREGSPSRDSVAAAALRCSEVGACLPD